MNFNELLKDKKNVYHLDGAPISVIKQYEEKLELVFSDDYVEYLKAFSLLSYGIHELTGVCDSKRLNVVDATLREKKENELIPKGMYLIESVGVENLTIWQNETGEIFEVDYKAEPRKICDSLLEYIKMF